ncbi:MAG: DUF2334 domain-containing protein [Candidatus Sumerlaeota bacterium]
MMTHPKREMIVCIHDVGFGCARTVKELIEFCESEMGALPSLAVVPAASNEEGRRDLEAMLRGYAGEIVQHGYDHAALRRFHPLNILTADRNEFTGRGRDEAIKRVADGKAMLEEMAGRTVGTFLPPTWDRGALTPWILFDSGFQQVIGLKALLHADGQRHALATFSWDCGRFEKLGWAGEALGYLLWLKSNSTPVIALHPDDVRRGFLKRIRSLVRRLRNEGFFPTGFATLGAAMVTA